MAGESSTSTAGTGTIPQQSKTPGDILMEQLLTSVISPTANSLLDISATTTGTGTAATTGTKNETDTQTGTKTSSTTSAAQSLIDQQISQIQGQLSGNNQQYSDMLGNILNQAAQTFNPTNATSRRSGAYNSTTLDQLRNDAQAKATAAGAGAILEDKRAKLASLVSLIEQNATLNKTEAVASTGNTTGTNTSNVTENKSIVTEGSKIGSGAADAAKVASAALLAKNLLGTGAGKDLTNTGVTALKKLFDMSGTSTGLPANWFDDLSGSMGSASVDDIIAELGAQEASQAAMEDSLLKVFGTQEGATSWLTNSGVSSSLLSSQAGAAGGFSAVFNAADGEWGWNDTGSTVGSVIGTTIGGPIGGAVGSTVGSLGGEAIGNDVESGSAFLSMSTLGLNSLVGDSCFITTACMKAQGSQFDDNCHELVKLREVRDNYIAHLEHGPALIAAYKEFAPKYVEIINELTDSAVVWSDLYTMFIGPAVKFADQGYNKRAYLTYLLMLQYIQEVTSFGGA